MTAAPTDDAVALIVAIAAAFHKMSAAGRRVGAVAPGGGGTWGLLRSLATQGPQTVPALARARPVARQRIQTVVDGLAAEGLVVLTDNPRHKRSRLVALTPAGAAAFAAMDQRVREIGAELTADFDPTELATTIGTLRAFAARLDARLVRPRRR